MHIQNPLAHIIIYLPPPKQQLPLYVTLQKQIEESNRLDMESQLIVVRVKINTVISSPLKQVLVVLFAMQQHVESQDSENGVLQIRVLVHQDGDHSDVGQEPLRPAHNVLLREPHLSWRVQAPIVYRVVVALGQELDRRVVLLVHFDHAMYDWNVSALHLEHNNLAHPHGLLSVVCEQEEIATVECRFHAPAEHHHDGGLAPRHHHQSLPDHQRGGHDHAEAQDLVEELKEDKGVRRAHITRNRLVSWQVALASIITCRLSMRWTSPNIFSIPSISENPILKDYSIC